MEKNASEKFYDYVWNSKEGKTLLRRIEKWLEIKAEKKRKLTAKRKGRARRREG